jgi:uncharacterized membrane protein
MQADEMQLAISYADLANSLTFRDLLKFHSGECERLELAALNAPATDFEACRSAIIAWQQQRLVVKTLEKMQLQQQRLGAMSQDAHERDETQIIVATLNALAQIGALNEVLGIARDAEIKASQILEGQ